MKTLILGAEGMLGTDLMKVFRDWHPIGWDIEEIDITDENEVARKLANLKPELVINAAAYTNVDGAETNKELVLRVNGDAVGYIAKACKKNNAILVHYSTDYVFAGDKKEGYKEDERPDPINLYGKSKALGEKFLTILNRYYLIRTAWLFGPSNEANPVLSRHKNFVNTMLKLGKEKDELRIVNDQHGSPTYTFDLAQKTREIVEENLGSGIYHLTNKGVTSWYKFVKKIFELIGQKVKVRPCKTKDYPLPAERPHYSILINTKLSPMRSWQKALKEYLKGYSV